MRFVRSGAQAAFVIPTRNRRERLLRTLESIRRTPGPDVEAVVVDNASSDGSSSALGRAFPNLRVISLDENLGAAARNIGARAARAPILIMLDDDSHPFPGVVEKLCDALSHPELGIAACMVTLPHGDFEEGGSSFVHIGCGAAMRRDSFLRLGGYPLSYGTYVEEYDLAYRNLAAGFHLRYDLDWRVLHEQGPRSDFGLLIENLLANNITLAWKFFPEAEAEAFCQWAVFRYGILAEAKGAETEYQRALASAPERKAAGLRDRSLLPEAVLDRVIPRRYARGLFRRWEKGSSVGFLRAGKEIQDLVRAAGEAGLVVEAIFDDGLLRDVGDIDGVPLLPLARAREFSGAFCVGGLSPGFIQNTCKLAGELGLEKIKFLS